MHQVSCQSGASGTESTCDESMTCLGSRSHARVTLFWSMAAIRSENFANSHRPTIGPDTDSVGYNFSFDRGRVENEIYFAMDSIPLRVSSHQHSSGRRGKTEKVEAVEDIVDLIARAREDEALFPVIVFDFVAVAVHLRHLNIYILLFRCFRISRCRNSQDMATSNCNRTRQWKREVDRINECEGDADDEGVGEGLAVHHHDGRVTCRETPRLKDLINAFQRENERRWVRTESNDLCTTWLRGSPCQCEFETGSRVVWETRSLVCTVQ